MEFPAARRKRLLSSPLSFDLAAPRHRRRPQKFGRSGAPEGIFADW
jgi:hypothetical protein